MSFISVSPLTLVMGGVIVALACVFMFIHMRSRRTDKSLKSLPGPKGFPVLGCAHVIHGFKNHWHGFSKYRKEYGDIYGVQVGCRNCVVLSNISLIKEVLNVKGNDFANRPDFLRFHAIFRGDRNLSIALCDWSDKQKLRREKAYPFMHPRVSTFDSSRMNDIILFEMQELVSRLSRNQEQPVSPRIFLNITTANIFYQYICNKRFSEDDPLFLETVEIYDMVFQELFKGYLIDVLPWAKIFRGHQLRQLQEQAGKVSTITHSILKEHENNTDPKKSPDLIDIYLQHIKENKDTSLTKEDIEVIVEDLIGGHSVLGNLWLWGLYFLAANPEARRNIREEVARVTSGMRAPTVEDRKEMPYTEATSYEIMRVVSSPIIPHIATTDTSISGYAVKKGSMVTFNTYDINMNPQLWHEPMKFNPARFVNSATGKVSKPDHFIPFGLGKRACLGDGLVKSTLFVGLATLFQNFDISLPQGFPEPDMHDIPGIVVPREEIRLVIKRLDVAISMA